MEKVAIENEDKAVNANIEDVAPKLEQAILAAEEEHNLTAWQAISQNKLVVFWCVFFAFSAVGW